MKITTELNGVKIIEPKVFEDNRGKFIKTFHKDTFANENIDSNFQESFYSISKNNVIRGMHFQTPPKDHAKLVYVTNGKILDVILDIRKDSPTYGKHISVELSSENNKMIYIPKGFAHGFLSLEDNSCMIYLQTTMHSPEHDSGIRIDSFDMNWGIENPIISERDQKFPLLKDFKTPFIYNHENIN